MRKWITWASVVCLAIASCGEVMSTKKERPSDPLPSWNDGLTKSSIIQFVEAVTDEQSEDFVAVADRVAAFDNDGNLWSEKPMYFQLFFAMDRVKALAPGHPEWADEQPFKAVLENDMDALFAEGEEGLLKIIAATHGGTTIDAFEEAVSQWLVEARHPRFDQPFTALVYQPMLELLDYLRQNDFKVFIVSGGGIEFMRPWVEEVYGIPRDQVVGSSMKSEVVAEADGLVIKSLPQLEFINDKEGKPIGINKFIGRKPIFTSGNSDGDLAMMRWAATGERKTFQIYLHHTDSVREWAYDRQSAVGRLDKGLDMASAKDWTVTDMARDWKVIYPFEKE